MRNHHCLLGRYDALDTATWYTQPGDTGLKLFLAGLRYGFVMAENGHGLAHGRVWTRGGELVASFAQEVLIRFDA